MTDQSTPRAEIEPRHRRPLTRPDGIRWSDLNPRSDAVRGRIRSAAPDNDGEFARKLERVDDRYGALGFAAVFTTHLYLVARLAILGLNGNAAV
jgi:hypothetical protein